MLPTKFRYRYRSRQTGTIATAILTIEEVESGFLAEHFPIDRWERLSRDVFTGLTDIDGNDIYENDRIRRGNQQISLVGVCAWDDKDKTWVINDDNGERQVFIRLPYWYADLVVGSVYQDSVA